MARDTRPTKYAQARESDRASTSEGERRRGGTQGRVTDLYIHIHIAHVQEYKTVQFCTVLYIQYCTYARGASGFREKFAFDLSSRCITVSSC